MLVVGEASGDAHGAQLVEACIEREPELKVYGVAGEQLQRTRFETLFSVAQLTGMGSRRTGRQLEKYLARLLDCSKQALRERRPNLAGADRFPRIQFASGTFCQVACAFRCFIT